VSAETRVTFLYRWSIAIAALYTALLQALAKLPNTTVHPAPQSAVNAVGTLLFSIPIAVQNLAHVPLYAVLGVLWCWAAMTRLSGRAAAIAVAAVLCTAFGLLIEASQLSVPTRTFSAIDAAANVLGALVGIVVFARWFGGRCATPDQHPSLETP
jgi:VanZ family protein